MNYIEQFLSNNLERLKDNINLSIYTWQASYRLLIMSFIVSELSRELKISDIWNDLFFRRILRLFKLLIGNYIYGGGLERDFFVELIMEKDIVYIKRNKLLKSKVNIFLNPWYRNFKREMILFIKKRDIKFDRLVVDLNLAEQIKNIVVNSEV